MSRVIVYTAIMGDCDSLKPAPVGADKCYLYTDSPYNQWVGSGWTVIPNMVLGGDNRLEAWRLRCVSHELFPDVETSVWIDASFTLHDLPKLLADSGKAPISALRHHERRSCYSEAKRLVKIGQSSKADIDRQIRRYQREGFSLPYLSISCVLVRQRTKAVQQFNETWLDQIQQYPGDNTQVSLDYSAWKHGLEIRALQGNRHENPYAIHDHADHRSRRRPYRQEASV